MDIPTRAWFAAPTGRPFSASFAERRRMVARSPNPQKYYACRSFTRYMVITTQRLMLRPWTECDITPFAVANADPEVRRYYYPSVLTRDETAAIIADCTRHLHKYGFGFMAVERLTDKVLLGGLGLSRTDDAIPGGPHVEIGWILARPYWRQGYAFEAASACLQYACATLGLAEVIGYTSRINRPSRTLMEKLGMRSDPAEDFSDVTVPEGNPLRPHVLYRIHGNVDYGTEKNFSCRRQTRARA